MSGLWLRIAKIGAISFFATGIGICHRFATGRPLNSTSQEALNIEKC